jgi:hypothetical protein
MISPIKYPAVSVWENNRLGYDNNAEHINEMCMQAAVAFVSAAVNMFYHW